MPVHPRPLSPHLQIYRWQIGNTLSTLHRLSGLGLSFGLIALTYWLLALAGDPAGYDAARRFFGGAAGLALLVAWTLAFFYHLLNGVRHLLWDAGYGFERRQRVLSGWAAFLGALLLCGCVWALVWRFGV